MKTFRSLCTFFLLSSFLLTSTLCFAQTSYVWDGSSSTAWATAANWTPSGVPAGSDDVTIVSAGNNPILSGNASVKSLTITSGTLDLNGFTLSLNKNLILSGGSAEDGLIELNTGSQANLDNVILDCELNVTAATLNIDNCTFNQEVTFEKTGSGSDYLGGNKYLAQANFINNSYTLSGLMLGWNANDTIMAGLYLENHAKSFLLGHKSNGNKVVFAGSGNQQLEITGTYSVSAYRADVNKPSGELLLDGTLYVSKVLILTNGILEAENGLIYFNSGATVSGTSDSSYIDGAVEKRGNQAFTFPVGKNGHYRPISISAPSSTSSGFRAEYFQSNSDNTYSHSYKDGSLDYLSTNEYWELTREYGSSVPKVTLSWDTLTSCGMTGSLSSIHVAGWNGSSWKDLGNGATTGNIDKGTVQTTSSVTSFNMFTLESDNALGCESCNLVDELPTDTSQVELFTSQYPLWQTGKIYLKIEDSSAVNLSSYPDVPLDTNGLISALFIRYGVTQVERPFLAYDTHRFHRSYRISFTDTLAAKCFVEELESVNFVEYAERVPAMYTTSTPNDPELVNQYHLPLINLDGASDIHTGGNATVAIVDDAVLTTHEDLAANIATSNWDAADADTNPNPPLTGSNAATPTNFTHGTHVAGIAGAVTNNNTGIASIGWDNEIMAVKVKGDANFTNSFTHAYDGLAWAAVNGADVINNSWGGGAFSQMEYNVVVEARDTYDAVIIAAAGNGSTSTPFYPAAYGEGGTQEPWEVFDESLVVAVASLDENNNRSIWGGGIAGLGGSNLGPWVDISGYGTQILSSVANASGGFPINNQYA